MMEHSIAPLSSSLGEGEASRDGDRPSQVDTEVEAEATAKANKQRRKIQNRKNQRAHRLRNGGQDPGSVQASRPFQVGRWHLDELDHCPSQAASPALKGPVATYAYRRPPHTQAHAQASLTPPSVVLPLSTDHLLHLVQYNVFRAFVSNKRTLNTLLTGWTGQVSPSPTTCPIGGPYRDDTTVYPLNPNIPPSLAPTRLQQTRLHSIWINLFPFPRVRDNLIMRDGTFDHWELLQDLIGELMSITPAQKQRGTPAAITVSDPKPKRTLPPAAGHDEDEVTAGRDGLIVWGEPYDMQSWEATPGFLARWSWAVEGCTELVESSNRWRQKRGEDPIRLL